MRIQVLKCLTTRSNKGGNDSGTKMSCNSIGFKKMMIGVLIRSLWSALPLIQIRNWISFGGNVFLKIILFLGNP